jgi:hypothetical protein
MAWRLRRLGERRRMRSWRNWQTRQLEGLVGATPWWFDSTRAHQRTARIVQGKKDSRSLFSDYISRGSRRSDQPAGLRTFLRTISLLRSACVDIPSDDVAGLRYGDGGRVRETL